MKNTIRLFSFTALLASLLVGCSGGDKDEMAPLSDDELLKRASQGREQGQQGGQMTRPDANAPATDGK
ncbi:MAG TPA: hypothetical protein VK171_06985 [Fimbriimonas sp.]|nr:hypothetical protein [Fimbriimonas sp.]